MKTKLEFLQRITSTESAVRKSVNAVRKLLDVFENEMLEELTSIKNNKMKELESEKNIQELHYTALDSFLTYSRMMTERGTDCEIIGAADDMHKRAEELTKEPKQGSGNHRTQLLFFDSITPTLENIKTLVGKIVYKPSGRNDVIALIFIKNTILNSISLH